MEITRSPEAFAERERCMKAIIRSNQRRVDRLASLCGLLDLAGWGIALQKYPTSGIHLGRSGLKDLRHNEQSCDDLSMDWNTLLSIVPSDRVALSMPGLLVWHTSHRKGKDASRIAILTPRQREVMGWISRGKTAPEIAIIIGCSTRTVEKHISNSYNKIDVHDRAEWILKDNVADESLPESE